MDKKASDLLRAIRAASGLTQADIARRLDVTELSVNSWFNDRARPRRKAYDRLQVLYFELLGHDEIDNTIRARAIDQALAHKFPLKTILSKKNMLNRVLVHFTYNTNSIEGSTMTLKETEELVLNDQTPENRTIIEQIEARNHTSTLLWVLDSLATSKADFSHEHIREIHLRLMNSVRSDAGEYRNHSVRILNSRTITSNPASIKKKLNDLFEVMNRSDIARENVIAHIARTHALFEQIHPFGDGNGRVGRLLMLELAIKHNVLAPLVMREKRSAYYSYLEQAQTRQKFEGLDYFVATAMLDMKQILF